MPTDVSHFSRGYKGKKSRRPRRVPRNRVAEHQGRTPQPGVPTGPRNAPKRTKAERRDAAFAAALGVKPPSYHRETAAEKAEKRRAAAAVAILRQSHLGRDLHAKAPTVPTLTGRDVGNRPGFTPTKAEALAAPALSDLEKLHKEGKLGKSLGQKIYDKIAEGGIYVLPEGAELKAGAEGLTAILRGATAADDVKVAGPKLLGRILRSSEATNAEKAAPKVAAEESSGVKAAAKVAGRKAARHPLRSGYVATAASPVPLPGELDKRARAFAEGTAGALAHHPGKTLATTGEAVLGAFTSPLAIGGAAVESAKKGSLAPLEATAANLGKGTARMVGNLASGDPRRVERTTLEETGLTPFIPAPAIGRALKDTDAYAALRGDVRGAVEGARERTRAKRVAAEKAAQESGRFTEPQKIRSSVPDSGRPGEHYVFRAAGRLREKQRARHGVSRAVTRMLESGNHWSKREAQAIIKELRRSPLVGGGKGADAGDVLRFAAKHGLRADERSGIAATEEALASYPGPVHGKTPSGVFQDRHAARWILDHPGIWKDEHFWKAVKIFKAGSEKVGTSERNRWLASADNVVNPALAREGRQAVLKPEEQVPDATTRLLNQLVPDRKGTEWSRSEAWNLIGDLRAGIDKAAAEDPQRPILKAKARRLEKSMRGLMKPPEHGGPEGGISTTRSVAYTPEMLRRFVDRMEAEHASRSLDKPAAYVADVIPSAAKGADRAPNYAGGIPARKVWPSTGRAAASGDAESSLESLLAHSVHQPRMRRAINQGLARVFDRYGYEVDGRRYLTQRQMERAINTHQVPDDTVWLRTQALTGALTGDHPLDPEQFLALFRGEVEHGQRLGSSSGAELRSELLASKAAGVKGEKYAPISGAAARELLEQMEPLPKISKAFAKTANASTRVILNSPAFALVQLPQEGLPMLAAAGRNLRHLPLAVDTVRRLHKLDPELEAQVKAVVGSSAGVQGAPSQAVLRAAGVLDPIRAAGSKSVWRHAWELVNGTKLGNFDKGRAGLMREIGAAAKVEGDFNAWRKGARNIFRNEQKAIKAMEGMSREQRLAYVAAHPRLGDALMQGMNQWMGNWNSFTRLEKEFAPLTVFYSFQRYSLLWMLYNFPLNHPVAATALAFLGAQNSNELRQIAASRGAKITDPLQYTYPVVVKGPGKVTADNASVLPVGSRTFPGLSSGTQALVEGNAAKLVGALQPAIAIAISASQGKDAFGQPLKESGFAYAARQIIAQSPAARYLKLDEIGKRPPSTISKAFTKLDERSGQRSVVDPYIGQGGNAFAIQVKLEQALKESSANGSEAREAAAQKAAAEGKVLPHRTKARMEAKAKRATNRIASILRRLGLEQEDQEQYELFKRGFYDSTPPHRGVTGRGNGFGVPAGRTGSGSSRYGVPVGKTRGRPTRSETETWGVPVR